ncbi:MAG: efflux RND transporter permease subunit, partial [Myxococcota bacterium]
MDERGTFLPRLAVQRPVTVIMSFLALLVLGAIAYTQIPLQLLPSGYTPPFLFAQIPTRPAPPKDVEETIAIPMEEVFGTVRNVHRQRTWVRSSSAGFLMEFKEGTDMDEAYNQVRDRIERKLPDLPTETTGRRYFIWKYNPNNDPVFWMGATLPDDLEAEDASFVLENRLVRKLERVPGVSRVEVEGAPGREIYIEIDDKKANAAGIGVYDLIARLQRDNFTLAGGVVEDSGKRYPIRIVARYTDLAQVRAIPIAANGLTLGDVAKVGYTTTNTQSIYRVNTEKGVILKIFKESQANTVEVCRAVREVIAHPDAELARFEFIDFFDQGYYIEQSLNNLKETTLWGGLFAVLILYAFLRQVRITSMITLAIPLSLLVTLVVMYFTGSTLNVLSLMGLMLSVGMVVDNAIVVVENIQRARADGLGPKPAAIYGAGEVALAIVVATSTTIVVFLPLILMSGSQTLSFYL